MNNRKKLLKQKKCFSMERSIIIIIMFMFVLLIGFNIIRAHNCYNIVQFFKPDDIYNLKNNMFPREIIEIVIDENKVYPMLEIIINGELFDCKFKDNNRVTITVCDGDVVQLNGSMYSNDIKIKIKNMSPNISNVLNNNHIILRKNIDTLAVIRM